jgi:uncharacterized glyoxalase superfamily protein PhnB
MQSEDKNGKNLFALAPNLLVDDVIVAAEYYRDKLGFQIGPYARSAETDPPYFTMVHRDGFFVQLRAAAEERPRSNNSYVSESCDMYFFVKDVDSLFNEFKSRQAIIVQEPANKHYQMRELLVQDRSGYVLGFATPIPPPSHERPPSP